ncbi:MAG: hypothetical protein ICV83_35095, partial [Cytophagales bacterium]|nr:hypothetical protein [Cytophagales bacterium]
MAKTNAKHLYMQPAAGDNGIAIGCAFYGWLEVLKQERRPHNQSTCFGVTYGQESIKNILDQYMVMTDPAESNEVIDGFFNLLNECDRLPVPTGKPAVLQFNIQNYGVYQVVIQEDKISSSKTVVMRPTCYVDATGEAFLQYIFLGGHLDANQENQNVKVSRQEDWELFQNTFPLDQMADVLAQVLAGKKTNNKVKYVQTDNYLQKAAQLLADGKVIAWFQDGSEFGPRALGKRSILADPRNPQVRDFINAQIKFREDFRPFAPSVLAEDVGTYFSSSQESPYMILVDQVRDEWREEIK